MVTGTVHWRYFHRMMCHFHFHRRTPQQQAHMMKSLRSYFGAYWSRGSLAVHVSGRSTVPPLSVVSQASAGRVTVSVLQFAGLHLACIGHLRTVRRRTSQRTNAATQSHNMCRCHLASGVSTSKYRKNRNDG